MPIKYKINPMEQKVKTIYEMSKQDAIDYIKLKNLDHVRVGWSEDNAKLLSHLVKTYIFANQPNCATCVSGGGIRKALDKFLIFFSENESNIRAIAEGLHVCENKEECTTCTTPAIEEEQVVDEKPKKKSKKDKE